MSQSDDHRPSTSDASRQKSKNIGDLGASDGPGGQRSLVSRRNLLIGAGVVALGAAGGGIWWGSQNSDSLESAAAEAVRGGTLRFGWLGYPEQLDPHLITSFAATNYANNIVDKLTFQNPDTGELEPWLATKWQVNDAYTEFTFTLRDDVTFSDGTPFTATSVQHNFDQYVHGDPALGIRPNGATHLLGYQRTDVIDEQTARIVFDRPYASFLQFVSYSANNQPGFLADATLAKSAEERLNPANIIATGPFIVTDYVPQQSVTLKRREDYNWAPASLNHEGSAYLDTIELLTIPEAGVRTGSLQSGDVDAVFDVQPTDEAILQSGGYSLTSRIIAGLNVSQAFNLSLPGTDDIAVRKAIIRATNRAGYKQSILSESEGEAKSVLSDNVPGFRDDSGDSLRYDLDEARQILDEAGWVPGPDGIREKDGVKLNLKGTGINLLVNARPAYESQQHDLESIGIHVDFTFGTGNLSTDQISRDYHLINYNRTRNDVAILNVNFNPLRGNASRIPEDFGPRQEISDRLEALESTFDAGQREQLAHDALTLIHEDYALANPIYSPSQVAAYGSNVHGILLDSSTRLLFIHTWIDQP